MVIPLVTKSLSVSLADLVIYLLLLRSCSVSLQFFRRNCCINWWRFDVSMEEVSSGFSYITALDWNSITNNLNWKKLRQTPGRKFPFFIFIGKPLNFCWYTDGNYCSLSTKYSQVLLLFVTTIKSQYNQLLILRTRIITIFLFLFLLSVNISPPVSH